MKEIAISTGKKIVSTSDLPAMKYMILLPLLDIMTAYIIDYTEPGEFPAESEKNNDPHAGKGSPGSVYEIRQSINRK